MFISHQVMKTKEPGDVSSQVDVLNLCVISVLPRPPVVHPFYLQNPTH